MYLVIIQKDSHGRWVIDKDSEHILEGNDGVFANGAVQEIEVAKITALKRHPNDPRVDGGKIRLPLGVTLTGSPDIDLITKHKSFPIDTRFVANDFRAYRYVVDEEGYRWIGEELWQLGKKK